MKVQLIVPRHSKGLLAEGALTPPQIGPLVLGSYIKKYSTSLTVEVYDENTSSKRVDIDSLDADIVGISAWFSNYDSALSIANAIKSKRKKKVKIVIGGPNVTGIERRILQNQPSIDYVVTGEGEMPLRMLVEEKDLATIPGLSYRSGNKIITNPRMSTDLTQVPNFDLSLLKTPYAWQKGKVPVMSAFPLSGLRGCFRKKRCDWCSIATCGVRTVHAERYWEQIRTLRKEYGINFFFESGDTLTPKFIHELAITRPRDIPKDVTIRGYSHVGFITKEYIHDLKKAGFTNLFFGIESNVVQGKKYSATQMKKDLDSVKEAGFSILPAMILGLPGQDLKSLRSDLSFLSKLLDNRSFAPICLLNTPYPFQGSNYFDWCLENKPILAKYKKQTGDDLTKTDRINIPILSRLFVDAYAPVGYDRVQREISHFMKTHPGRVAYWVTPAK